MGTTSWPSVTEEPCVCKYLENSTADPNTPIRFDPELNEYNIVYSVGGGSYGSMVIYHCPFCGGLAPQSNREKLFAVVPDTEYERLRSLTTGIKSVEDAFRILGSPSSDEPVKFPEGYVLPVQRDSKTPIRALTFTHLSELAEIQVSVNGDKSLEFTFYPKYIGPLKKGV